jgi:phosphatidate cytidylyltransferase
MSRERKSVLVKRLVTGIILIAVFIGVLWIDERFNSWYPLWLLLALAGGFAASLEMAKMLQATAASPSINAAVGGTLAVALSNWGPSLVASLNGLPASAQTPAVMMDPFHHLAWPAWAFVGVLMATFLSQGIQYRGPGTTAATLSGTVLVVAYVALLGSFALQHRWLGPVPLVMLIAVAKGSDTGAYTIGRLFGKNKLWPRLSPNKTREGSAGGLAFGVLAALLVAGIAALAGVGPPFGLGRTLIYGLLVGIAAQLGDLMESMIKRDCATKDASSALPGLGGVLDVLDSILFAAPVSLACWLWLWP